MTFESGRGVLVLAAIFVWASVLAIIAGLIWAAPPKTTTDDLEALLQTRDRHRVARWLGDPGPWVATFVDPLLVVDEGEITESSSDAFRARVTPYLEGSTFLEWEDAQPPRVLVADGGIWATVLASKRVRLLNAAGHEVASLFAWMESWTRGEEGWRLAAIASTEKPVSEEASTPAESRREAADILARSRAALGGSEPVIETAMVAYEASCTGPPGTYDMTVRSARDGRVFFRQRFPDRPAFAAGRALAGGWTRRGGELRRELDDRLEAIVHGHEFPLLAVAPEARYRAPAARGEGTFDDLPSRVVRFADRIGSAVDFHYDPESGRPLGYAIADRREPEAPPVQVSFLAWERVGEVLLPEAVVVTHGEEEFRCRLDEVRTDWLPDDRFTEAAAL